jgi:hypothetical protein
VKEFLKRFWAIAASIAALVGAYLGAAPLHLVWVFWLGCGIAAAAAGASLLLPRSLEFATRIRNYPILLKRAGVQEDEIETLKQQMVELKVAADKRWSEGLAEGRQQILGAALAQAADPLTLTGVVLRQGSVLIIATPTGAYPKIGARYNVEVTLTGDVMGVIETRDYDEERQIILLECVDAQAPKFWERLAESAALDSTPPQGVDLIPYRQISFGSDITPIRLNLPGKNDG